MVDIRSSWFDQNSGPPPGNKLPAERNAWQLPPQALAISDRGKEASAEELAKQMLVKIRYRGCKEEFIANPDALAEGKVEFLASDAVSEELMARLQKQLELEATMTRKCTVAMDGESLPFEIFFNTSLKTNGGYMFDIKVTFDERESLHRIIVGKSYYNEERGMQAEDMVEKVFAFLLKKKIPRHSEGIRANSQFPVNYFSVTDVHQFFADFEEEFALEEEEEDGHDAKTTTSNGSSTSANSKGAFRLPDEQEFWRFNKVKDYGYKDEDPKALALQFALDDDVRNSIIYGMDDDEE